MRPMMSIVTGVGAGNVLPLDNYISPFNVTISAIVNGAATFTVQYTLDDVQASGYSPATGNWFNHPDVTGATTSLTANIAFPVTAVRLLVTAGTGTVNMTVIQAGVA